MTEKIIYEYKPDIIYTHFNGDLNIDHQIISRAVVTASRPVLKKNIKKIYMMEILSSSDLMLDEKYSFYPNSYVDISNSNLVFMAEMGFDGLFGYETVATRLIKKFGAESMLSAYAKRQGNLPTPGQYPESLTEAKKFADNFEIQAIEIIANSEGILDFTIGHPSQTLSTTKILESNSIKDIGQHKTMIISTGKDASNDTLGNSLSSLWNCSNAIKKDGLAILVAECKSGLGSDAIQQYIEDRLTLEQLRNPTKYVNGMEDLLFLSEIQKNFQIGLVSILPEFYVKKLDMISLPGIKYSMDYILKTQGARQKVAVVSDGARLFLR